MTKHYLANVLLVEDDKDDIEFFKEALELVSPDSNLIIRENCIEGVDYLINSSVLPDVIFMDLSMHRMDGFECIAMIKSYERFKAIPIVVLSTSIIPAHLDTLYQLGVTYFITKPASFSKLQAAVSKIVNTPSFFLNQTKETFHITEFD